MYLRIIHLYQPTKTQLAFAGQIPVQSSNKKLEQMYLPRAD